MTRPGQLFLLGSIGIAVLAVVVLWATTACHLPAWQATLNGAPSCAEFWLNRYQGLLGAIATLFAGFLAYRAAIKEARRAERQARDVRKAVLNEKRDRLCQDLDALKLAASYIDTYVDGFPANATNDAYYNAFMEARTRARDSLSQVAIEAPDRFGARIQTVMTSMQKLASQICMSSQNCATVSQPPGTAGSDVRARTRAYLEDIRVGLLRATNRAV
jgi:hypothetical protein